MGRRGTDDIIAVLVKKPSRREDANSGIDKDFIQLQKHDNVKQYAPIQKKMEQNNGKILNSISKIHILKDRLIDSIPNFLSNSDDMFVNGFIRQKPISKRN